MPEPTDKLEREVAAAFEELLAPRPDDAAKLAAMIAAALEPPAGPPTSVGGPARAWPKLVGVVGVVGVAVAALLAARGEPSAPTVAMHDPAPTTIAAAALDEPRAAPAEPLRVAAPVDLAPPNEPPPLRLDATDLATSPVPATATARPARERTTRRRAAAPAPAVDDPDELLRTANQARRARDFDDADRIYTDLQARFPGSRAARTSRVPHARVLLDTLARPTDALAGFDAYLAVDPGGTLAEEALIGRAQALRRLGRTADARSAWRDLLARFPDSAHAPAARGELAEDPP